MVKKKVDSLEVIADLLPEGLSEEVANKIAVLVDSKIQEEVNKVKNELVIKTNAFIRGNIEKLKEQALKELELEDDVYRNAQMYETVKAMFAVENTPDDEVNAVNSLAEQYDEAQKKIEVLAEELDKSLRENVSTRNAATILKNKISKLESQIKSINEQTVAKDVKLSETAVIFNADKVRELRESKNSTKKEKEKDYTSVNEFLTPDMMERFEMMKG